MPDSKRAWPDYLDLESKVSGLCLMNISINHPGCPWNNYLAEPTAAGKRLAGDTERLYEQPRRYARCCCRLPQLRSWLVLCNRCLFMPPRGCFSRYLTFLRCRCPGELTPTSEAHETCQRCQLPPHLVKCKPGAHLGLAVYLLRRAGACHAHASP